MSVRSSRLLRNAGWNGTLGRDVWELTRNTVVMLPETVKVKIKGRSELSPSSPDIFCSTSEVAKTESRGHVCRELYYAATSRCENISADAADQRE
jgi:hypothetical protein